MRTICLYFQVHQPFRFRRYRFFDIGNEHYYYDDYLNESILRKVADRCYLPANKLMLELLKKHKGKFKISFSISGIALDQFEMYAPEVIDSFRELADTGFVEFLSETYTHSLVPLKSKTDFISQVEKHKAKINSLFNYEPKAFRMTELIYSDAIGAMVADMGYKVMLTEGAKHILGWKSPNFLYYNAINPKLKVLLRNFKLSDDISFRFSNPGWSEYPLRAGKFMNWLKAIDSKEETINIFMDYETFGEHQPVETGIFDFIKALPGKVIKHTDYKFSTPTEIAENLQPVAAINVPYPISWADEERDLTAWLGNELQQQAFNTLYELKEKVKLANDPFLSKDFESLQISDHFYYMSTKFFSDGEVHSYFNPYDSPYEAFINYMNVLSDFEIRVNAAAMKPSSNEVAKLSKIISKKDELIERYKRELTELKSEAKKIVQKSLITTKEMDDKKISKPSSRSREKTISGAEKGVSSPRKRINTAAKIAAPDVPAESVSSSKTAKKTTGQSGKSKARTSTKK
jgi:alpha-amylase